MPPINYENKSYMVSLSEFHVCLRQEELNIHPKICNTHTLASFFRLFTYVYRCLTSSDNLLSSYTPKYQQYVDKSVRLFVLAFPFSHLCTSTILGGSWLICLRLLRPIIILSAPWIFKVLRYNFNLSLHCNLGVPIGSPAHVYFFLL